MIQVKKSTPTKLKSINLEADMPLINRHALRELSPDEVFAFPVILSTNDVDRDGEFFTTSTLNEFAKLYVGKSGIFDHSWTAQGQTARIYKAEIEDGDGLTATGEKLKLLRAYAYIPRIDSNAVIIAEIESGIKKEVSIGCSVKSKTCSICGATAHRCEHNHMEEYDGEICYFALDGAADVYEWSFVAVPANIAAGVTKSAADVLAALDVVLGADFADYPEKAEELKQKFAEMALSAEEKKLRAEIIERNKAFLSGGKK